MGSLRDSETGNKDETAEDLRVEAVNVDYYLCAPLPEGALERLLSSPSYLLARHVPVVRVFGATPAGQKTCVHIHGLFPYFYFRAEDDPVFDDPEELRLLLPRIAMDIEKANDLKQRQQQRNRSNGSGPAVAANGAASPSVATDDTAPPRPRRGATAKLVAKLLIVQGTPFYGYHARPRLFVQIFLYNPRTVASVVQLLESGCIAERVFQPYEAHIPFLLQVFADYNIEGMNAVHLSNVMFRAPLPTAQEHLAAAVADHDDLPVLLRSNVSSARVNGDAQAISQIVKGRSARVPEIAPHWFDRQSQCALEVDVAAECILNPQLARKLRASSAKSGENMRNVPSLAALWEEERLRRIQNGEPSTPVVSLSVDRNVDSTPHASAKVAHSAASSLWSQSFFRQKMEDASSAIIKKLMSDMEKRASESGAASNPSSLSMDDGANASSSLLSGIPSAGDVSTIGNNSIATESAFSFSQIDHDPVQVEDAVQDEPHVPDESEDQAIVDLLLSMQHVTNAKRQEQVQSRVHLENQDGLSEDGDTEESDIGEAVADTACEDEIGDILASQRHPEIGDEPGDVNQKDQAWWDVVPDEAKVSNASSVFELGSLRIDVDALAPIQRPFSLSTRAKRGIDLKSDVSPSNEDSAVMHDIEDLLPPPPPPNSRGQRLCVKKQDEKEDSVAFDPLLVSLTPQPRRRRANELFRQTSPSPISFSPRRRRGAANRRVWLFQPRPPTLSELVESSKHLGIEAMEHKPAFYSVAEDIPEKPLIFSGKKFDFTAVDLAHTLKFDTLSLRKKLHATAAEGWIGIHAQMQHCNHRRDHGRVQRIRVPVKPPPTVAAVSQWCKAGRAAPLPTTISRNRRKRQRVVEPLITSLDTKRLSPSVINSNLTILSVEVHANARGGLLPDPRHDRIEVVCYAVEAQEGPTEHKTKARGVIMCKPQGEFVDNEDLGYCIDDGALSFSFVSDERDLISKVEELVRQWDPDFLAGFEVQKESIGYLVDRASQLNMNLIQTLSRLPTTMVDSRNLGAMQGPEDDEGEESGDISIGTTWGVIKASGLWIHGRFILNIWRLARSEVKLSRYSREDIVRAVLKREFPLYSAEQLTTWYQNGGVLRWKTIRYTLDKVKCNLQLLSRLQLVTRTSEMARLFGMDFYSVLSRGSQYRVESMMLRLTKRHNYLMVSPNRIQVARQAAMECIPLVMEPQSSFYPDPVVVLDFQSLYPSLVIGYNLCYSTIFGRLRDGLHAELETSLGAVDFVPNTEGLVQDRENVIMAPNGVLLSSKAHRLGVLPVILEEILSTRIMVKNAMKSAKQRNDERLEKVLNARQLALKLLANVTYGYTAAGFSGRMPCAQLADAIVQSGRSTLEAAVRLVEGHATWNAKVVYGDTDSLFVLLRGRSKDDSFRIGQEIANAVTAANPKPVTLKMEKVYMGCILVSKKRYVGLKYEVPDQLDGVIESKGVEIVRRDSCGVVQHSMQRSLELLFATSDLSLVKKSLEDYWLRMLDDQIPLKDFVFAKEVRLGTYVRGSAPPAALVSAKAMAKDSRAEPRYAERVPYVVVNGPPGARLMELVVSPTEFLDPRHGATLAINYQYYIHKQMIPSLERLFLLMGANVRLWYTQLPRVAGKARSSASTTTRGPGKKALVAETRSIDSFYMSKHCRLCGTMGQNVLCRDCESHPQRSEFVRQVLAARRERSLERLRLVCTACGRRDAMDACMNVSCDVWNRIRLVKAGREDDDFSVDQ